MFVPIVIVMLTAALSAQRDAAKAAVPDDVLATWSGTWDGGGSGGGFELTLERGKDGAIGGKVLVTGEPSYEATLRAVSFDGRKMTASYDFTPEPAAEVVLTATFESDNANGTWSLREKASGSEAAGGGWKVAKKKKS
jgi:hypothetical protein